MVSLQTVITSIALGWAVSIGYKHWAAQKGTLTEEMPIGFISLTPDVFRLCYIWKPFGPLMSVDINVFLVKSGDGYILVDAGVPGDDYEQLILSSLKNATDGRLKAVLLTHGHTDHVGALPAVVRAYPDIQVTFHELEAPFLAGSADYSMVASDSVMYKVMRYVFRHYNVTAILPPPRVLLLSGETGDVADARGPNGEAPRWQLPHGLLTFLHTPGHSPGQVAYLLQGSKSLIPGDTITSVPGKGEQARTPGFPPTFFTANNTQIRLDARKLAALDFERGFPSHQFDHGAGLSKAEIVAFAQSLA